MTYTELTEFATRHPYLSMALAALTIALIVNIVSGFFKRYKVLGPAAITTLMNQENALVVDLRPMADYEKGHIPGSKNVQISQFDPENKQLGAAKDIPVVLVCKMGQTSFDAAKRLVKAGFTKVYILDGGIANWMNSDLPLAKGRR